MIVTLLLLLNIASVTHNKPLILICIFSINMLTSTQTRTNLVKECWRRWAGQKEKDLALTSKALQNFPARRTRTIQSVTKIIYNSYLIISYFYV